MKIAPLTLLIPLAWSSTALSAESAESGKPPAFEVNGVIYAHYGLDLTEGAEQANSFDIDRVYFGGKKKLNDDLLVRVTLDVGREKSQSIDVTDSTGASTEVSVPEDTKIRAFVKFAYLEWATPLAGVKTQFGAVPTPYTGFYDKFWGYRFASKNFTDEYKVLDSADLGVNALGKHGNGLLDWQVSFINGEGYGSPEVDAGKAAQARITVDPLKDGKSGALPITGFVSYAGAPDGDPTLVYLGALGYKMEYVIVMGEYLGVSEGDTASSGYSGTVVPRIPNVVDLIVRYDHLDPDTSTDDDAETRMILGLGHQFFKGVNATCQYERTTAQSAPDLPEHGAFLRMQAEY